ncbi:MAG: hypothetical protein KF878_12750 [Planctomycetes bacterium]|nr:hypothetical protein [Planctomycetota bacterium]
MSDAKLRELERRWRETGAVEDEAAYLLERVRVGDLTRERLELAAYCGHEGARRAVGDVQPGEAETLGAWASALISRWRDGAIRASEAVAVAVAREWLVADHSFAGGRTLSPFVESVRRWQACQCDDHRQRVVSQDDDLSSLSQIADQAGAQRLCFCALAVRAFARASVNRDMDDQGDDLLWAITYGGRVLGERSLAMLRHTVGHWALEGIRRTPG